MIPSDENTTARQHLLRPLRTSVQNPADQIGEHPIQLTHGLSWLAVDGRLIEKQDTVIF
jgi:hypothetical protein